MAGWQGRMTWSRRWKRRWSWLPELAGAAAAGRGREGRNLQRGEGGEEGEERDVVASLPLENRLLVQEKGFCGVFNGWRHGVQRRRKKKEEAEEENLQRGEGRPRWWGFGFVGRLRHHLLVEEECFCGASKGWRSSGERERERRENVGWKKNRGETDFLAYFGPHFILPQAMKSTYIYR